TTVSGLAKSMAGFDASAGRMNRSQIGAATAPPVKPFPPGRGLSYPTQTPVITCVWVGYDKPRPGGKGFTGGSVAAPIWERFMRPALASKPAIDFARPDTVV